MHATPRSAALLVLAPVLALGLSVLPGCSASSSTPPVPSLFEPARAWKHAETLVALGPRPAGSDELAQARSYIATQLESYGLTAVMEDFRSDTPIGEVEFANVYADIGPADAPLVILCTHIDTKLFDWEFVGANDSAAGTAVLLELARVMAQSAPSSPKVTYRMLFIDGEESINVEWVDPDNRYGSRHHVKRLRETGELSRTVGCVLLDLIGDKKLKLSTETYSDSELLDLFFDAARRNGLGAHVGGPRREIKDDHLSFMAADIRSVDLIDFEYGPDNAYWHDPRDTLENISADSMGVIGSIVLHGLPELEAWALRQPGARRRR